MFFDVVSISSKRVENTHQSLKLHVSGQAEDGGIVVACEQLTSRQFQTDVHKWDIRKLRKTLN